jgi:peptidoglycan/xylan/chitin deacetylase (PgdA/CDA1 family)
MKNNLSRPLSYSALGPFRGSFSEGVPILAFHKLGSLPPAVRMKSLYVQRDLFAWQMRDLKRAGFLADSLNSWRDFSEPNQDRAVLTFDDGSRSVFRHALPVLARHKFTAIQFLVADAIGGSNSWDIRARSEAPDAIMDAVEVRDWLSAGQEIGAHTLTHPSLTAIPKARAEEEITASKRKLEDLFGVEVRHFCYPYGKWSLSIRDLVERAGYSTAVTLDFGVNAKVRDPFALRRIGAKHPSRSFRNFAALIPAGFPLRFFWQR